MSLPKRSDTTPSHTPNQHHPPPAAPVPETKTLNWHKQNFANQQKAWQRKVAIEGASSPSAKANRKLSARLLNKPLPVRRVQTDDRGTLRVANPDITSTADTERMQTRSASLRDASASSMAGQKTQKHKHTSRLPSEVSSAGMLGVPLSVYGFRGTLPAELQPNEPPLRWDAEPAPQIPPVVSRDLLGLYGDGDLAKYMTADKSDLQEFREKMPVATTIVKGQLGEFVEK